MSSNASRTPQTNATRERRKNRLRAPFGDEDIPIVFAGAAGQEFFLRRTLSNRGTALIYDERMLLHENIWFPDYVECPDRLSYTLTKCSDYGLIARCLLIPVEPANDDIISYCHESGYIELVAQSESSMDNEQRKTLTASNDSAFFNEHTNLAARLSVGSLIQAVDSVHRGDVRNAFCLIRPPGHHAIENEACGFCIFNNIAIAAKYAIDKLGYNRVLIVDWDVHHGNATQYTFYDDPKVLFISIHRYDNGEFWPNLREANYDFIGTGRGKGFNINIPLNTNDVGDSDYLAIFHRIILPIAYEYDPDLVLISAGYDSAFGCPLGQLKLSPSIYAHFTQKLMGLAEGKLIVTLEGGYYLNSLSESVGHTLSALLGDPMPSLETNFSINPSVIKSISNCISVLRFRWKSLCIYPLSDILPPNDISQLKFNSWLDVKHPEFEPVDHHHKEEIKKEIDKKFEELKQQHPVAGNNKISGTCIVYDSRMENHKNEDDRSHPETPHRIRRAYELLEECGLARRCKRVEARFASRAELIRVHTSEYIDRIAGTATMEQSFLNEMEDVEDSIYFNRHTYDCARLASGSVLAVIDEVCKGNSLNGIALVRPPGHHAFADRCMGFCFFNHVAVGARHAQKIYNLERIAIVDWDVHHGNGTAKIFENDPNILYLSVHRHDEGRFFPNSDEGDSEFCGIDEGLGRTVQVAWNGRHIKDGEYMAVFIHVIIPILYEFHPQLIIVSAGFDAVRGDRIGGLGVSPECFGHLTHLLMSVAHLNPSNYCLNQKHLQNLSSSSSSIRFTRSKENQEKIESYSGGLILVLEGGYHLSATAEAICHCVASLLGDCSPRLAYGLACTEKGFKSIRKTIRVQENYWNTLKGYDPVACHYDHDVLRRPISSNTRRANAQNYTPTEHLDEFSLDEMGLSHLLATPAAELSQTFNSPVSHVITEENNAIGTSYSVPSTSVTTHLINQSQPNAQALVSETSITLRNETLGQIASTSLSPSSSSGTLQNATTLPQLIEDLSHLRVSSPNTGQSDQSSLISEVEVTPHHRNLGATQAAGACVSNALTLPRSEITPITDSNGVVVSTTIQELINLTNIETEDIHSFFGLPNSQQLPSRLFAVTPLSWCPHLTAVRSFPNWEPDINGLCNRCDNRGENWVCLSCYSIYCGRYANSHMIEHFSSVHHPIVLSFADLSSWCYECESYVHNEMLFEAKRAAHRAKFGEDMPSV